jgi:hypothetical protein
LAILAAIESETRELILAEAPSQRLTETDAEIVPLIEKIGANSTGEIEKLIGGMQEAKNWRDLARQHQNLGNPPPQTDPLPARN